jgi:hypothetical protein
MSPEAERHLPHNRARRHFLGVAIAASAKVAALGAVAMTLPSQPAQAMGRRWGRPSGGNSGGREGGGGNSGGHEGSGGHEVSAPNCFLRGTSVMTPTGEVRIEDLQIGDLVETLCGDAKAVKWVGRRLYKQSGHAWHDSIIPIRISRGALGLQTPHRDLYLSANHALFVDGVLIRVKDLVNGMSIARALPAECKVIEYFHIMLDTHEVILAEGAAAETFLLRTSNYESFTNFVEYAHLHSTDPHPSMTPFAPIVGYEGGREHLKALLSLGVSRFVELRDPVQDAYEKIAARARQLVG